MRLLYIVNRIDGPGGLERVLSIKATMLADHYGYEVHIITLNQDNDDLFYDFSPKLIRHNITSLGNPLEHIYTYVTGLNSLVKKLKPDVIAVCDDGLKGLFVPLILGKPCPIIYERHVSKNIEIKNEEQSLFKKMLIGVKFWLMNFGGSFYDHFVVLTKGNLEEWDLKNLKVIPNPLSFYPEAQSTLQNKKVLAVGKQSFQKGYDRLLKSWKSVVEKHPDWILDIYGTINSSEGLSDLADTLGISQNVNFYDPVKNIAEKYQEASIYVMSSRYEGFGMVLTEAMAYGVPCVSFDCPYGPSDIISHGIDGYLVSNGDTDDLGHHIMKLIEHEEERMHMGIQARKNVKTYLPETIVGQWDFLFRSLTDTSSE